MARYSSFLGRRVEVQYRAGDILLPASGVFVADSGRSIFLEQSFEQRGKNGHFRWEIPYQCLVRIEEKPDPGASANAGPMALKPASGSETPNRANAEGKPHGAALAAAASAAAEAPSPSTRAPKPPESLLDSNLDSAACFFSDKIRLQ